MARRHCLSVRSDRAVLLCGHGSRDDDTIAEFELLRAALAARRAPQPVLASYLEFAAPDIREGLRRLYEQGARRILALPVMLYAARHVKRDIPRELDRFAREHPDLSVGFGRELARHPKLIAAAAERIAAAERRNARPTLRSDSLLLVIGRGTNDAAANGQVAELASTLGETMGFGQAAAGYAGAAEPNVTAALEAAAERGCARVLLFPYFLFTGVLVKRVHGAMAEVAARHPRIDFIAADHLKHHPLVIEALAERLAEIEQAAIS